MKFLVKEINITISEEELIKMFNYKGDEFVGILVRLQKTIIRDDCSTRMILRDAEEISAIPDTELSPLGVLTKRLSMLNVEILKTSGEIIKKFREIRIKELNKSK